MDADDLPPEHVRWSVPDSMYVQGFQRVNDIAERQPCSAIRLLECPSTSKMPIAQKYISS